MRRIALTAIPLLLAATAATAQTPVARDSALRREVEGLNRAMETAFGRGDLKGVAAFYADNAVVRSAHQVAAVGRSALDAYWAGIASPKSWKLDVYGVTAGPNTNLVYQTGRSTLVSGSPPRTSVFDFVVVWQRQSNGQLKIVLDYYHTPER